MRKTYRSWCKGHGVAVTPTNGPNPPGSRHLSLATSAAHQRGHRPRQPRGRPVMPRDSTSCISCRCRRGKHRYGRSWERRVHTSQQVRDDDAHAHGDRGRGRTRRRRRLPRPHALCRWIGPDGSVEASQAWVRWSSLEFPGELACVDAVVERFTRVRPLAWPRRKGNACRQRYQHLTSPGRIGLIAQVMNFLIKRASSPASHMCHDRLT